MDDKPHRTSRYDASAQTNCIECCPFETAHDLILFATESTIEVLRVSPDNSHSNHSVFTEIQKFPIGSNVTCLGWSKHSLSRLLDDGYETKIVFAASFEDRSILLYASGYSPVDVCRAPQMRHQNTINAIAFDKANGHFIASVGDDNTCRIWTIADLSAEESDTYPIVMQLKSRGVSVCTHEKVANQVLVGEASGAIRILNIESQTWMFSVFHPDRSIPEPLLRCVDWNPLDPNILGAAIGKKWHVWSLKGEKSIHLPEHSGDAHIEIAHRFKWCLSDPKMFLTSTNSPEASNTQRVAIKVFSNVYTQIPNTITLLSKSRLTSVGWLASSKNIVGTVGKQIVLWYVE